ncbi:MAG: bifunctional [glutamate--ammonia ligase]-adenylyl-L-tyrosine phosphorylase/[glutamate--ammonia-ligase] adenylyltransferase [Gammaproteobacteria bacterium]|nr:bifunctional [glutamate--ammonia ligase]-adenylyl-L-tyrosine phosphorylase/[glutamate--ammonia-ligase] adenylyltransferase [Gammaproteobacteria bacterium]
MMPKLPLSCAAPSVLPPILQAASAPLLARFAAAVAASGISAVPVAVAEKLAAVFAVSPFVAEVAIRSPARWLASLNPVGEFDGTPAGRARRRAVLAAAPAEATLRAALRQHRTLALARSAWFDILGERDLAGVLAELSALAQELVDTVAQWLYRDLTARFGTPTEETGEPVSLVVIAMGKLGGGELNFSSDIDLIFAYRAGGETQGGPRTVSNQEFFDRLGKRLIAILNDVTDDGFVYRVDMRLRPFGDSGALTASFAALEQYYVLHGRDWERYALIKARVIHGTPADIAALAEITRPFVYRRYLDFGAFESVREMKALIDAEIARDGLARDIKRGAGGIREIEFIAQAFQLVRGGREPRLRECALRPALEACGALGLLSPADVLALHTAYGLLRVAEHRLQQVNDAQTQTLPLDPLGQARLAFGLGYADWATLETALAGHRLAVRQCFELLLLPSPLAAGPPSALAAACLELWQGPVQAAADALARVGFSDPPAAAVPLAALKDPRFLARLSGQARGRLDRLMPRLLASCAVRPEGAVILGRIGELVLSVARRSVYLALLADHDLALTRLVDLCQQSVWVARQIARWPILLDELLDARLLATPPTRAELVLRLDATLAAMPPGDLDGCMDSLRNFKHQQVLRVAACDLLVGLPVATVSNHLTWIAEVLLEKALALAWNDLVARYGEPLLLPRTGTPGAGFAVIAYGKLGGRELGYSSDLDLVFVHDSEGAAQTRGPRVIANDLFFTRVAQRVIHLLTTRTAAGAAYELDIRLRPSGASGLLVTSLAAFRDYQCYAAWTWEHQALLRARGLVGSRTVLAGFESIRGEVLSLARPAAKLRAEIVAMLLRVRQQHDRSDAQWFDLKHGVGGITDIEFMVQYTCLCWASQHAELWAQTDNLRLLEVIARLSLWPRDDCQLLHDAYFAYRAQAHRCALREVDGLVAQSALQAWRTGVTAVWQRLMVN